VYLIFVCSFLRGSFKNLTSDGIKNFSESISNISKELNNQQEEEENDEERINQITDVNETAAVVSSREKELILIISSKDRELAELQSQFESALIQSNNKRKELQLQLDQLQAKHNNCNGSTDSTVIESLQQELSELRCALLSSEQKSLQFSSLDSTRNDELIQLNNTVEKLRSVIAKLTQQRDELFSMTNHVNEIMAHFMHKVEQQQDSSNNPNTSHDLIQSLGASPSSPQHNRVGSVAFDLDSISSLVNSSPLSAQDEQLRKLNIENYVKKIISSMEKKIIQLEESEKEKQLIEQQLFLLKNNLSSESIQSNHDEVAELNAKLSAFYSLSSNQQAKIESLQTILADRESSLIKLQHFRNDINEWKERQLDKLNQLKAENSNINNFNANLKEKVTELEKQVKNLTSQSQLNESNRLNELQSELSSVQAAYQQQKELYQAEIASLQHQCDAIRESHTKLSNDYSQLQDNYNQLLSSNQSNSLHSSQEFDQLNQQIQIQAAELLSLKALTADQEQSIDRLKSHAKAVADSIRTEYEKSLEELEAAKSSLQAQQQQEGELQAVKHQFENELSNKQFELNQTKEALSNLQQVVEELHSESEGEKNELNQRIILLTDQLQSMHTNHSSSLTASAFEQLNNELAKVNNELQLKTELLQQLQTDNSNLRKGFESTVERLALFNSMSSDSSIDRRVVVSMLCTFFEQRHKEDVLNVMFRLLQFTEEEKCRVLKAQAAAGLGGQIKGRLAWILPKLSPFDEGNSSSSSFKAPDSLDQANIADLFMQFLVKEVEAGEKERLNPKNPAQPLSSPNKYPHLSYAQFNQINNPSAPTAPAAPAAADPHDADDQLPELIDLNEDDITKTRAQTNMLAQSNTHDSSSNNPNLSFPLPFFPLNNLPDSGPPHNAIPFPFPYPSPPPAAAPPSFL
jgi:chromosome segregation ATPase